MPTINKCVWHTFSPQFVHCMPKWMIVYHSFYCHCRLNFTTMILPVKCLRPFGLCPRILHTHDDVMKWRHFPRYWPFVRGIHRSRWIPRTKGQWRRALMFSLMCVWINDWVNNREAGDLRRHRGHYDVTVMSLFHTRREYNNALKTMSTSWESVWEGTKTLDHNKIHRGRHIIFYLRNVITGVGWKYVIDKIHYFIFPRVGLFEHKAYHQQRRVEIRQRLKTS